MDYCLGLLRCNLDKLLSFLELIRRQEGVGIDRVATTVASWKHRSFFATDSLIINFYLSIIIK